jgi:hypothetical protein
MQQQAGLIYAPFTEPQAEALNRWQKAGTVHPFTCPTDHDGDRDLIAYVGAGWCCPTCGYTQLWAHESMLNAPPSLPFA